jgi:hypothetical protein
MDTGAASSPDYRRRAEAGRQLATLPELTPAAGMLMRLLLDPDDTAVTLETAEALLSREDGAGLELLLRAAARGDEDTLNELATAVHNHVIDHGNENLDRRCAGLLTPGDPELTLGARRLLS